MMMPTVALTGGSGFIGTHVARMLTAQGYRVRALSRFYSGESNGVHWIKGSLENRRALAELMVGARTVVHCAGAVRGRDERGFHITNVLGSRQVMEAAREGGDCERFLLMSSLAARHPELSWYANSKYIAEQEVLRESGEVSVGIFRPTAVYGPGDQELEPLFSWLLRGLLLRLGASGSRLTFLHVYDLALAVVHWVTSPFAKSDTFEISDDRVQGYSWKGLAGIGAEIRRAPVRQLPISLPVLNALARLNLGLSYVTSREPMLTTSKVKELVHEDWSCSNTRITNALGWEPQITLKRALKDRLF